MFFPEITNTTVRLSFTNGIRLINSPFNVCVYACSIWLNGKITINTMRVFANTRWWSESKSAERRERTEWKTIVWSREHSRRDLACAPFDLRTQKVCIGEREPRLHSAMIRGTVNTCAVLITAILLHGLSAQSLMHRRTKLIVVTITKPLKSSFSKEK